MNAQNDWGRRRFLKTLTASLSLLPAAALSEVPPTLSREQGPALMALPDSSGKLSVPIFDPLLDPRCRELPRAKVDSWPAHWIWYPGQLTAHLHAKTVHASMARCAQVGYPSSFRQPLSFTYFRKRTVLSESSEIRWAGPLARIRFILNGAETDITLREKALPAGPVEIVVRIDFAHGLPCLLLDGGKASELSTNENWETSLDFREWVEAEGNSVFGSPDTLPDEEREVTVEIPVDRVVQSKQVTTTVEGFLLAAGGELVVDFRHDELGQLAFELEGQGELTTRVGESIPEVLDPNQIYFEQRPIPPTPCASQDRAILLPPRALRYACYSSNQSLALKNLRFLARVTPVQYHGHFECNDPEVNAIWAAGAATIHSCLHSFYLDGIRRDGLPWDDGIINFEAADSIFCESDPARNAILALTLPSRPTLNDLGIIDAPLYVVLGFESDWLVRGELKFSQRYRDRLQEILDFYTTLQDASGFVNGRDVQPYGFFPDWSATPQTGPDAHGTPAYAQMLLMRAFEIGAAFAGRWNDKNLTAHYDQKARHLRTAIQEHFWDSEAGAFANGLDSSGQMDRRFSSFAQVFAILFDLAPEKDWPGLFKHVLENPVCRAPNLSIFYYYEFMAYAKAGRMTAALQILKRVWGGLLKQGYTRFMEDIRPQDSPVQQLEMYSMPYGNSLCHDWAGAAAIILLVRGILGIWPKGAGYAECEIRPLLGGLTSFKGSVPTPSGPVSLDMKQGAGGMLSLPPHVRGLLKNCAGPYGEKLLSGPGNFQITWD